MSKLYVLLTFSAILSYFSVVCHEFFDGAEHWQTYLNQCKKAKNPNKKLGLKCYLIVDKMVFVKVEVLSENPMLLRYHQLIHPKICKLITTTIAQMNLAKALTVDNDNFGKGKKTISSNNRVANSTWLGHHDRFEFSLLFNRLQRAILALDLRRAEMFQVLSYSTEGHYAPHNDYLEPHTLENNVIGNRLATVLTIIQTAGKGGTTLFPFLDVNIRPRAGDVLVWHSLNAVGRREDETLHGACPIKKGVKIGVTLWVRDGGQELRTLCKETRIKGKSIKSFEIDNYLKLNYKHEDRVLFD